MIEISNITTPLLIQSLRSGKKITMIYRLHHDESYLMHVVPPVESINKLGEKYGTFAFNAEPKSYKDIWQPLHIKFLACEGSQATVIPDISENFGRLFLSEKAHRELKTLLKSCGECLPVTFDGGQGYLFNPLLTAEQLNAVDKKLTVYDAYNNLESFSFVENNLGETNIFKTELDTYKGIFCSKTMKDACVASGLTGVVFYEDVSNPIGGCYGLSQ